MLNEKLEFQSYTYPAEYDPAKPDEYKYAECMKMRILGKGKEFSGIRRPMVLIARYYLSQEKRIPQLEERLLYTETALRLWVGDKNAIDNIISNRIFSILSEEKQLDSPKKIDDIKKCIRHYVASPSEINDLKDSVNKIASDFFDDAKNEKIKQEINLASQLKSYSDDYKIVENWFPNYIRYLVRKEISEIYNAIDQNQSGSSDTEEHMKLSFVLGKFNDDERKDLKNILDNILTELKKDLSESGQDNSINEALNVFCNGIKEKYGLKEWPDFLKKIHSKIEYAADQYNKSNQTLKRKTKDNVLALASLDAFKEECANKETEEEKIETCLNKFEEYKNKTCFYQYVNDFFGARINLIELYTNLKYLPANYGHKTFTLDTNDALNSDFNRITYEEILMEVYNMKPENRYYLFQNKKLTFDNSSIVENQKGDSKNHVDLVLKMISLYLMKQNETVNFSDGMYLPCPKNEIINWCDENFKKNEHCDPEIYLVYDGKTIINEKNKKINEKDKKNYKPLFKTSSDSSKQQKNLLWIDPDVLTCFELVSEENFESFKNKHSDWFYYSDLGFGNCLKKEEKYS